MAGSDAPAGSVRALAATDEVAWRELYRGYRDFYELPASEEIISRVWGWLMDAQHECEALVVESDGGIIAIGHYRRFARPIAGSSGIWLDDLFTTPEVRGKGAARAVIGRLTEIAAAEGRSLVRWITAEDNAQAQVLYDQVATRTSWVTYDAAPSDA